MEMLIFAILLLSKLSSAAVKISDQFYCSKDPPGFVTWQEKSEKLCLLRCMKTNCQFYDYQGSDCKVDNATHDAGNDDKPSLHFVTFEDLTNPSKKRPLSSSSVFSIDYTPENAVDGDSSTLFKTKSANGSSDAHWWTVDLYRSFEITEIEVIIELAHLNWFFNIKIFLSDELNLIDLNSMPLFVSYPGPADAAVKNFPPSGGSSMCGRYLTIAKFDPENYAGFYSGPDDPTELELNEVKISILNAALYNP